MNAIADGINCPKDETIPSAHGIDPMPHGIVPIADGINPIADGINPIADGINPIADGINPMPHGIHAMADGINPIRHGMNAIRGRMSPLADREFLSRRLRFPTSHPNAAAKPGMAEENSFACPPIEPCYHPHSPTKILNEGSHYVMSSEARYPTARIAGRL